MIYARDFILSDTMSQGVGSIWEIVVARADGRFLIIHFVPIWEYRCRNVAWGIKVAGGGGGNFSFGSTKPQWVSKCVSREG